MRSVGEDSTLEITDELGIGLGISKFKLDGNVFWT